MHSWSRKVGEEQYMGDPKWATGTRQRLACKIPPKTKSGKKKKIITLPDKKKDLGKRRK